MTTWRTLRIWSAARIAPGTSERTRSVAPQITSVGWQSREQVGHRVPDGAPQRPQEALFPLPVLELPLECLDQPFGGEPPAVKDGFHERVILAAPDALHGRQ